MTVLWGLLVMFVGWIIIFLTNIPINFLTIFVLTILGYILGEVIRLLIWQSKTEKNIKCYLTHCNNYIIPLTGHILE
ncbi:hypothetical protein ACQKCU_14425 [Heyndrickxia sporothermodurans]